jgi:beta-lactamase regulating signal transducer with metallopeptidase domain
MGSILQLTGLGVVASAFIRILAAYALFFALTRLTSRFRARHALWLLFVIGAALYWTALLVQLLEPQFVAGIATHSIVAGVPAGGMTLARFTVPDAWAHRVEFAGDALACGYAGGLFLMVLRLTRRRRSLRRAVAKARLVSPDLDRTFRSLRQRLGVSRTRIMELPGLSSPGVAYTWKPVILIPEDLAGNLDSEQLIDVLYHELIHIRRLDFLWGTLGDLAGCLLFFHPAVWLALRNLGRERELACDEAVVRLRRWRRADYASCLSRLARRRVLGQQLDPRSHLALLNSSLAHRVQALLSKNHPRSRANQTLALTASLGALVVFCAGWSSLSLALELAPPSFVSPHVPTQRGLLSTLPTIPARRGMRDGRSKESKLPLSSPTAPGQIVAEPEVATYRQVSEDRSYDTAILDPQVDTGKLHSESPGGSVWDEERPTKPVNSGPSLGRIALNSAIGALGHVALGGRSGGGGDGDGDRDADHDGDRDDRKK